MPFTPAHPAIILPLLGKRSFSATGLIAGSIAPDFEYFFRMRIRATQSHTLAGLFYFDLPVALLIALVFHTIVKKKLIANLPAFLQRRMTALRDVDFFAILKRHPLRVVGSCMAGASSHLLWDSFTHSKGYFVRRIHYLYDGDVYFLGGRYPAYYALQHISTVIGLASVLFYVLAMKADPAAIVQMPRFRYWALAVAVVAAILCLRFVLGGSAPTEGDIVVSLVSAVCCALILNGALQVNSQVTHG